MLKGTEGPKLLGGAIEAAKLEGLRAAARLGIAALERGEFKEFVDGNALMSYLNELADLAGVFSDRGSDPGTPLP